METEVVSTTTGGADDYYVGTVESETSTACSFTMLGSIVRMCVKEGDHVRKGQLIAQLDPTQAKNMLLTSEAQLRQAKDALERMRMLHEKNSIPEIKWVEVQTKVDEAETSVKVARKAVEDCSLTAPVSGVIGSNVANTGETALPSQPVCQILNIATVKVKVSIPEKEISNIQANTKSEIGVDALNKWFTGGRVEKGVEADVLTHTYDIKINVANPHEELLPGMVCKVKLNNCNGTEAAERITVPIRCIQQGADGKHFVWTIKGNCAHRQNVVTGEVEGNRIAIEEGLNVGVQIITAGYQKVSEGTAVVAMK